MEDSRICTAKMIVEFEVFYIKNSQLLGFILIANWNVNILKNGFFLV